MLNVIIQSNPNYHDAVNNLERASNLLTTSFQNTNDDSLVPADNSWSLPDPLMLSFDGNEIGVNSFLNNSHQEKDSHRKLRELSHHLQNPDLSGVALDQLKLAEQAFKDKNFDFALKLCDKACLNLII